VEEIVGESRFLEGRGLLAAAGVVAVLAMVVAQAAAAGTPVLPASGVSLKESVPPGAPWTINFNINAPPASGSVSVVAPAETFSFSTTACAGSFTDPFLGGTTVYGVGKVMVYSGSSSFKTTYYGYAIHLNSASAAGADYSEVWGVGAYVSLVCAIPSIMSPNYAVISATTTHFGP
jgi:hypothetical protein